MAVSKPALGEALRQLEHMGLITIYGGFGGKLPEELMAFCAPAW